MARQGEIINMEKCVAIYRGIFLGILAVGTLVQLYFAYILKMYADQKKITDYEPL